MTKGCCKMPTTESEWQDLRDFFALEMMEYKIGYIGGWRAYFTPEPIPMFQMYVKDWCPDCKIAQAMLILKTILAKAGKHATAELMIRILPNRCRVTIQNWVATGGTPASLVRSPYVDNEMQAICLAAEEWLKA